VKQAILYGVKHDRFIRTEIDFAKCGTPGNYQAHRRRGEKACQACLRAEARRSRDAHRPQPSGWAKEKARRAKERA
jgi:hypothetical protein